MGSPRVGHNWATFTFIQFKIVTMISLLSICLQRYCIIIDYFPHTVHITNTTEVKWNESRSVVSDSLQPTDYTVHGILQIRILEWVAFPFSGGSFQPRGRTQISCIAGGFYTSWATREALTTLNHSVKNGWDVRCCMLILPQNKLGKNIKTQGKTHTEM